MADTQPRPANLQSVRNGAVQQAMVVSPPVGSGIGRPRLIPQTEDPLMWHCALQSNDKVKGQVCNIPRDQLRGNREGITNNN